MRFQVTTSREALFRAVSEVQGLAERRSTNPILSHLLLKVENSALVVIANNLETEIRVRVDAESMEEGAATAHAKKLHDLLRELTDAERVTLEAEDGFVSMRSERTRVRLASLSSEEYPSLAEEEADAEVVCQGSELAERIAATMYAASQDETRRYLTGVLFEAREHGLRLVATDGHRLAWNELTGTVQGAGRKSLVPRRAVQEIRRIAAAAEDEVQLFLGERQLKVQAGNATLLTRLVDAAFPDYESVVPKGHARKFHVEKDEMERLLRRAMVIADEFPHPVELALGERGLDLVARNVENEEAQLHAEGRYEGEPVRLGFNARYLKEAVDAVRAEHIRMEVGEGDAPALILPDEEQGTISEIHVVMPMKI